MKNNTLIIWSTVIIILLLGMASWRSLNEDSGLANPASVNCAENGGKLEIRTDSDGGQYGVCKFNDGTECEEWAYFRGTCKQGQYKAWEEKASETCIGNLQLKPSGAKCCAGLRPDKNFQGQDVCAGGIVD